MPGMPGASGRGCLLCGGVLGMRRWQSGGRITPVDEPTEPEITNADLLVVMRSIDKRMARIDKNVSDIRTVIMLVGALTVIGVLIAFLAVA